MKRKLFKSLLAMACLLGSTSVSAYDFNVNGIYYNVVSLTEFTCEVTGAFNAGDVVIPATVDYANRTLTVVGIGTNAFNGCRGLTSVTIPNSVTWIGSGAFYDCYGLTSVEIPNSVTWIGPEAFSWCSGLTSVTFGNSVIDIDYEAFSCCSGLTSVTIPNSVIGIANGAFKGCSGLTNVSIGNSVIRIGNDAFYNCYGLTSVTLGNSVTEIGSGAFYGCGGLTTLYSLNTTPPSVDFSNFTTNQYMTLNVVVPQEAIGAYQNAELWKNFWNLQGFNATAIENVKVGNGNASTYYDLRGHGLNALKRGLNIINGKKVLMKQ